jgi:hypothetical protein
MSSVTASSSSRLWLVRSGRRRRSSGSDAVSASSTMPWTNLVCETAARTGVLMC